MRSSLTQLRSLAWIGVVLLNNKIQRMGAAILDQGIKQLPAAELER